MAAAEFAALARQATHSVQAFAEFVERTEFLFLDHPDAEALEEYQALWFEAEIVNALSLERWEHAGRPAAWDAPWRMHFQQDAARAVAALAQHVSGLEPG